METRVKILEILTGLNQPIGVISTVNTSNKPESASIYYVNDDNLNIYFITRAESRKFKNIGTNPNVSFVITGENEPYTIQLEGKASIVTDPKQENEFFTKLVSLASKYMVMPPVSQMNNGEIIFMRISTEWVRFGNFEVLKEGDKFIETTLK